MRTLFLTITLFLLLIPLSMSAEEVGEKTCFPEYKCSDWSDCDDRGFQTRNCEDKECGRRDIVERSFCDKPGCKPSIECGDWGQCFYTEKTDDLIEGKISFGGYMIRPCWDANGCVDGFTQERACSDVSELKLSPKMECGVEFLEVSDLASGKEIAKISIDSWKLDKLDISFVQGSPPYCPSCYNTIQDEDEEGVDCGGDCQTCRKDSKSLLTLGIILLWSLSALFSFFSVREAFLINKKRSIFIESK